MHQQPGNVNLSFHSSPAAYPAKITISVTDDYTVVGPPPSVPDIIRPASISKSTTATSSVNTTTSITLPLPPTGRRPAPHHLLSSPPVSPPPTMWNGFQPVLTAIAHSPPTSA
ncbi:hypothetical protein SprV_0301338300 [Sparganum proliferum]